MKVNLTNPEILIPVVRHDSNDLITVTEGGDELADVPAPPAVLHDRNFVPDALRIACHVYPFDSREYLA